MSGRRSLFLQELGIGPVWVERAGADDPVGEGVAEAVVPSVAAPAAEVVAPPIVAPVVPQRVAPVAEAASAWDAAPAPAPNAKVVTAQAESAWDDAPAPAATARPVAVEPVVPVIVPVPDNAEADAAIATMSWSELKAAVATCTRCPLCQTRTRTVFGTGDEKAGWLFVGEGPGRNEDREGLPFVGPAGKLLDNMLLALALRRGENVYIANAVKCRPVDADGKDRAPTPDESAACRPYLARQIALLKPVTIVALGKVAALSLLGSDPKTAVAALRERVHYYGNVPLVVTYHPAYLLRKPLDKAKSWRDLCLAAEAYAGAGNLAL